MIMIIMATIIATTTRVIVVEHQQARCINYTGKEEREREAANKARIGLKDVAIIEISHSIIT